MEHRGKAASSLALRPLRAPAAACLLLTAVLLAQRGLQVRGPCAQAVPRLQQQVTTGGSRNGRSSSQQPATCEPPTLEGTPWAGGSCQVLRDVCVDQGTIILYGPEHAMTADRPGTAPYQIEPGEQFRSYVFLHRNSSGRDYRYSLPPIRVRPAGVAEGAAYLRGEPVFSECTVPVVLYPMWASNFAHFFRDNAAKLLSYVQATPWADQQLKLVLVTAEGHAMPDMNAQVVQPLLGLEVETWADFSARLPAVRRRRYVPAEHSAGRLGLAAAGAADDEEAGDFGASLGSLALGPPPPASFEGGPQRCFRSLLVCNRGLNITRWPLHALGQRLARHYAPLLPQPPSSSPVAAQAAQAVGQVSGRSGVSNGKTAAAGSAGAAGREQLLRIIFHKRSSQDRQLLNAGELLERCNGWRFGTADGRRFRATCREVEMSDLFSGLAAAREADIFVAAHGANQANGWLLRPGASMIELQAYGFDAGAAHLQYPLFNAEDNETQVQWWMLSVCDPKAWTPGVNELEGKGRPETWPKFRNLIVRWEALQTAIRTAVEVAGNMTDYRRRWQEGRWWWWLGPGGSMQFVGPGRLTKKRCPGGAAALAPAPAGADDGPVG